MSELIAAGRGRGGASPAQKRQHSGPCLTLDADLGSQLGSQHAPQNQTGGRHEWWKEFIKKEFAEDHAGNECMVRLNGYNVNTPDQLCY